MPFLWTNSKTSTNQTSQNWAQKRPKLLQSTIILTLVMFKVYSFGGISMFLLVSLQSFQTQILIYYGVFATNGLCIFYWYRNDPRQPYSFSNLIFSGKIHFCIFNLFMFMGWISHLVATTADPGYQKEIKATPHQPKCLKCKTDNWKPSRTHHCSECNRCIFKMDHHCPWINNCVGYKNYKSFNLFTVYICLGSLYSAMIHIICFI